MLLFNNTICFLFVFLSIYYLSISLCPSLSIYLSLSLSSIFSATREERELSHTQAQQVQQHWRVVCFPFFSLFFVFVLTVTCFLDRNKQRNQSAAQTVEKYRHDFFFQYFSLSSIVIYIVLDALSPLSLSLSPLTYSHDQLGDGRRDPSSHRSHAVDVDFKVFCFCLFVLFCFEATSIGFFFVCVTLLL